MLYGRLVYGKPGKPKGYVNIGDYIQTFAIDCVYEYMGIDRQHIVNIDRHDLRVYDGDDVILPLNAWFGYKEDFMLFSDKIHPVFIGFHNLDHSVCPKLSPYEPIGCRDEATYHILAENGVAAYISGCMTVLFPKRNVDPIAGKVFLVDLPENVIRVIPNEIVSKAVYVSHEVAINESADDEQERKRIEKVARQTLQMYRDEAALVITSRLHAALPCIAMGIPVIILRDGVDERFTFLDKFIKIYNIRDKKALHEINWKGVTVDIEEFKHLVMMCACDSIKGVLQPQTYSRIHDYYMDRVRTPIAVNYKVRAYETLHKKCPDLADFIRDKILFRFTIASHRPPVE